MLISELQHSLLRNSSFLMPFAITLTHNGDEAKDLMQDTIYRALSNSEKFSTNTNLKAWLFTIMRNIFINNYRRKNRENNLVYKVPQAFMPDYIDSMKMGSQESTFAVKEIKEKVYNLPQNLKTPFLLYFEGYKYQEIADFLNEPLGTVKSRIHFARKLLQERLPGYSS